MKIRFLMHRLVNQTQFGYAGILEAVNLGRQSKMSMQMLTNKLNPHSASHNYNVDELEIFADVVNAHFALAEYHAQKVNAVVVQLPDDDAYHGDMSLLDAFMDATVRAGDFANEFQRAWADGRVTEAEFAELRNKVQAQVASQLALLAMIERVAE